MGRMTKQDGQTIDLASVFPAKGDARRPPEWWGRALLYAGIAVFVAVFLWRSWGKVDYLILDIVISLFVALAIEPLVIRMVRHGWKRGVASATALVGLAVVVVGLLTMFGNMFVQQMISMLRGMPDLYSQLRDAIESSTSFRMPEIESLGGEILKNIQASWVSNLAGTAISTVSGLLSVLLNLLTVVMVTYYISAAGPRLRRSMCQWLGGGQQRRFLLVWTIVQDQISSFLFSRTILAAINAACTAVFLEVIQVPYWLPLALFCGLVSQFIPTVGTYIGGALPVLFAWADRGWVYAVAVLVFIIIYQQIENLILSPKISQRTMDINAAVAFLAVLAGGSLFGALGAFLALPMTASLQAIFKTYARRYELVDSPLMNDPEPTRKSKVVEGAEAFAEHVIKPVSDHMPRAVQGTSSRVPMSDELRRLQDAVYAGGTEGSGDDGDGASDAAPRSRRQSEESETVAIPRGATSTSRPSGTPSSADNPRAGWR